MKSLVDIIIASLSFLLPAWGFFSLPHPHDSSLTLGLFSLPNPPATFAIVVASKRCNHVSIQNNEVWNGGSTAAGIFLHRSSDSAIVSGNHIHDMQVCVCVWRNDWCSPEISSGRGWLWKPPEWGLHFLSPWGRGRGDSFPRSHDESP